MKSISMLSVGSFVATPTGLIVNGSPTFDEWLSYGKHLQVINQSLQMLIGDWLNEGEKRYGETYTQATEIFPEAQLSTLKNWKWVASRVPKSLRRDGLHYSHYNAVAGVETESERAAFLNDAALSKLNSRELQNKVKPKPEPVFSLADWLTDGYLNAQAALDAVEGDAEIESVQRIVAAFDAEKARITKAGTFVEFARLDLKEEVKG